MPSMRISQSGKDWRRPQAIEVARDGDVESGDLPAFAVEEIHAGLPGLIAADDVDAARGAYDGVGDLRISDQNVFDIRRQIDRD